MPCLSQEMYPGVAAARGCVCAARLGSRRAPETRCRVQQAGREADRVADGAPHRHRLLRADAARAAGQRRRSSPDATGRRSIASRASVDAGLHVLADKPWILTAADLPTLDAVLAEADRKGVVAYDIMTERFEITTILQRALVNDAEVFGEIVKGTEAEPSVYMESVHHLMKVVSGAPNLRPAWFFDARRAGRRAQRRRHASGRPRPVDAVSRRVDRLSIRHPRAGGARWPTVIPEAEFQRVTGGQRFGPDARACGEERRARLRREHAGVVCAARRAHEAERDLGLGSAARRRRYHFAYDRGSGARIEVRQTAAGKAPRPSSSS